MESAGLSPHEEQLERQLAVLDAVLLAASRREEVLAAVAGARDADEARQSIAHLLDVTNDAALAVVEVRLVRFSQREVARLAAERELIRTHLDETRLIDPPAPRSA